ncbi:MAG: hypothetical protein HDS89_04145 [Bacteroidales bacterium]|nr:hypothetical protein [Bacteroidales bacterium]
MIRKLFIFTKACLMAGLLSLSVVSCGDNNTNNGGGNVAESTEVTVSLPASVDVVIGSPCVITCANNLTTDDVIYLVKDGKITTSSVIEADANHFSFNLKDSFEAGTYKLEVKRGDRRVSIGNIQINWVASQIAINPGTTIYGIVESAEGPIAGVVVSDGVNTTVTDEKGIYQLASDKKLGYVFISVPSGYECQLNGVFPDHYRTLVSPANMAENQSFKLNKVDQSNYSLIFMGDMHVASRSVNNDLGQFRKVAADIKNYVNQKGGKIYGITLGDMTWDLYWYTQKYGPADYAKTINEVLSGLPIYHTIGNHDNDMNGFGNLNTKSPFATSVAPPYYSFNIGDVHYIMLDNVDCATYVAGDGSVNRDQRQIAGQIYDPQWEWLKNDLQYVDKSTPILVMMHVPVFATTGVDKFSKEMKDADKLLAAFDGYNLVHYVTGHTHRSYNLVPEDAAAEGRNIYEHNLSAICSDWWWSGALTPGLLQATDGTPSGYGVWDITGKDIKWIYKCTGKDENFQFRSYDLNNITFSKDKDVPDLTNAAQINRFNNIIAAYNGNQVGKNEVLINVWQSNSRWTCTVKTADGKDLAVQKVSAYDPVQIMANVCKRMNEASCTSNPIGTAQNRHHFYKVIAPDADTDLIITVKDEFGHTYTETMERPKAFNIDTYKIEIK